LSKFLSETEKQKNEFVRPSYCCFLCSSKQHRPPKILWKNFQIALVVSTLQNTSENTTRLDYH